MSRGAKYLVLAVIVSYGCGVSWGQKATNPFPADGATDVVEEMAGYLMWTKGKGIAVQRIYLGTTPELGPEHLVQENWALPYYVATTVLTRGTTYYWRVDGIATDKVTIHEGDMWSFTVQPLTAFRPDPADGSAAVAVSPELKWLAGQDAVAHQVYLSDNKAAVVDGTAAADKGQVTEPNYAAVDLLPITTYFWRVDEIDLSGDVVRGDIWSFTTILPVDDFEGYTDFSPNRVFQAWVDGEGYNDPAPGNPGNGTGATVGHNIWDDPSQTTIVETKVTHNGSGASMPFYYDNTGSGGKKLYSEVERTWTPAQNWTANDANVLTLHVHGLGRDFDILPVTTAPVIDGNVDAIWATATILPVKTTIAGDPPTNPADASGQFRVLYDMENLYALVDVNDEALCNDSSSSYLDDSVEFYVDGDNTKAGPGLAGNARQYTFGWTTADVQGTNTNLTGVEHAQVNTATGWRIEIKLPWQSLMGTGAPVGKLIGIDCFYNDDDDGGETRESQIAWHSTTGNDWQTAASWGTALVAPAQAAGSGTDRLYVALQDTSNRSGVVFHDDPKVIDATDWVRWSIPLSSFAEKGVSLTAVQKMLIGVGNRDNPTAGGAGILYIDDIYLTRPAPAGE
jgi:hypothetical protein